MIYLTVSKKKRVTQRGSTVINIAICGVGGWGQNHARVFAFLRGEGLVDNVMLVDIDENRVKMIARRFGFVWTTKYEDVLKRDDIDGIVLATPTKLHFEQAKQALNAGKHVLVEKPMTETVREAMELVRIAKEQDRILMTGFLLRYSPATLFVKKYYEENKLGKPLSVLAKRTSYWPNRPMDVGVIRDLAIHDIDLIRYIFNVEPVCVLAQGGMLKHDYEDYASIFIKYKDEFSGILSAMIEVNWVTPYKIRRMEVTGENAVLIIDYINHTVEILREEGKEIPNINYFEPLYKEDKNFVLSITGKEKPFVTGRDGVIALKVCEAALRSIQKASVEVINEVLA